MTLEELDEKRDREYQRSLQRKQLSPFANYVPESDKRRKVPAAPAPKPKKRRQPLSNSIRPCVGCGRATRPAGSRKSKYPETIQRFQGDYCKACWMRRTPVEQRKCAGPGCDNMLPSDAPSNRQYCGNNCRVVAYRQRKKEVA